MLRNRLHSRFGGRESGSGRLYLSLRSGILKAGNDLSLYYAVPFLYQILLHPAHIQLSHVNALKLRAAVGSVDSLRDLDKAFLMMGVQKITAGCRQYGEKNQR